MFDTEMVDALFDASMNSLGVPPGADLMNPNVLIPFADLPRFVEKETSRSLTPEALGDLVARGWFKVLQQAGWGGDEDGVTLVTPSRIGLLLDLQDAGWTEPELRAVAEYEDEMTEWVFTSDMLRSEDSPTNTLGLHFDEEAKMFESEARRANSGGLNNLEAIFRGRGIERPAEPSVALELAARCRNLAVEYRALDCDLLPPGQREKVLRLAYHVAVRNDYVRVMLLESDRQRVRAGYSPFVVLGHQAWGPGTDFEFSDIMWGPTVHSPWFLDQEDPILRVPGLALRGTEVRLTDSPSPSLYDRLYREHDIGTYLLEWASVTDARVCQHCFRDLPTSADSRRRYCSEKCRNAAKQARYRERHPGRVFDSQVRYYGQFDSHD